MHNNQFIQQAKNFIPVKIISTGAALPEGKLTSEELDRKLNKPNGYCLKRSGIEYRYHADYQLNQADLAAQAVNQKRYITRIYRSTNLCFSIESSGFALHGRPYSCSQYTT